jgi:tRNA(Arg) A34 adenosine deaminase TadA
MSKMIDSECMRVAIDIARQGITAGQSPFGAAVVYNNAVIATAHNTVWLKTDPTAHAEVICIRAAAKALKTISLRGCSMFSTTEPCPMCLAAIHWAKIDRVVFGATIADAATAGFKELFIDAKKMVTLGGSPLIVESGLLQTECAALFNEWKKAGKSQAY